jgi:hypothetical protein
MHETVIRIMSASVAGHWAVPPTQAGGLIVIAIVAAALLAAFVRLVLFAQVPESRVTSDLCALRDPVPFDGYVVPDDRVLPPSFGGHRLVPAWRGPR